MFSWVTPKVEVRSSLIGGRGLFAKRKIKKGEIVTISGGRIVFKAKLKKISKKIQDLYFQIDDNFYLGPGNFKKIDPDWLMNHSCHPNVGGKDHSDLTMVALRDIKKDEEICYDYATSDADPDFKMKCSCGSVNCRKIITGNDWKRKDLQKKYKGQFATYIQAKINRLRSLKNDKFSNPRNKK